MVKSFTLTKLKTLMSEDYILFHCFREELDSKEYDYPNVYKDDVITFRYSNDLPVASLYNGEDGTTIKVILYNLPKMHEGVKEIISRANLDLDLLSNFGVEEDKIVYIQSDWFDEDINYSHDVFRFIHIMLDEFKNNVGVFKTLIEDVDKLFAKED